MRVAMICLLSACAPRLHPGFEIEGGDFSDSNVSSVAGEEGVETTQVQATAQDRWIYFDFETKKESAEDQPTWDLAFQRFKIRLSPSAAAAVLKDRELTSVDMAPEILEQDSGEDYVFTRGDGWYYYDLGKHTLAPRHNVYVVRSSEGALYKLEMLAYYDSLGSSGYPAFRWMKLP